MFDRKKKEIIEYGKKIFHSDHVAGTSGNLSCRGENGANTYFLITPSGMQYDALIPDDIVIMDLSGNKIEGKRRPSIEYSMHSNIYKSRNEVNAVIHTHSIYTSALAVARIPLPVIVEDLCLIGDEIKVAPYARAGSQQLANNVVNTLGKARAVILANHGLVSVGKDLKDAFKVCEMVERVARIFILAKSIGKAYVLSSRELEDLRDFLKSDYGQ